MQRRRGAVDQRAGRQARLHAIDHRGASASNADPAATASGSEDGLLPRCILAAFASMKQREAEADFTVSATCLELYNEAVTDLLGKDSTKQLQVGVGAWGSA